jgi:acetate kinase
MIILVANLGSTSFKYRVYDMPAERQLARGGIDRIGQSESRCTVEIGEYREELRRPIPDHAAAVQMCLDQLTNPQSGCLKSATDVKAIGFKAVFAGHLSGIRIVDEPLLAEMERLFDVAPAHNPPYARAMRQLKAAFPQIPLVAALETAFHDTIPPARRTYAVPFDWKQKYAVQRWGFHGASHRYIGSRMAQLLGRDDTKVISCHLGGSNSLCAIKGGVSLATSMGMSPQTGLLQNNRVGDFDPFALPILLKLSGRSLPQLLVELSEKSGLLGLSGISPDMRDVEEAAAAGNERAELAINVFAESIRQYLGSYLVVLNGADAIVFTGGIGENSARIRRQVCADLTFAGIELDAVKNETAKGETCLSTPASRTQIWVVPTNEEIIVARQSLAAIQ